MLFGGHDAGDSSGATVPKNPATEKLVRRVPSKWSSACFELVPWSGDQCTARLFPEGIPH